MEDVTNPTDHRVPPLSGGWVGAMSATMEKFEYRVVWKRVGLPSKRAIYQTLKGAQGHVCRLKGMKWDYAAKGWTDEASRFDEDMQREAYHKTLPAIEYIHLEQRPVGEWPQATGLLGKERTE